MNNWMSARHLSYDNGRAHDSFQSVECMTELKSNWNAHKEPDQMLD